MVEGPVRDVASPEVGAPPLVPTQPAPPPPPVPAAPPLVPTRRLLGASFDLIGRTRTDLRRASFYIGAVVLGTVGPLALALWAIEVIDLGLSGEPTEDALLGGGLGVSLLVALAVVGLIVAVVESRTLATALLGGELVGRPVTVRQALARARTSFWRAIAGSVIVAIPIGITQAVVGALEAPSGPAQTEVSALTSTLVTALVGAPFAYVLAGIVLGDVGPIESVRRSIRVFRPRKVAAIIVAGFDAFAALLLVVGLSVGLDLVIRVLDTMGLDTGSGPLGQATITTIIVVSVFALGTLIFTVYSLIAAPQVVMFVGLTHATYGLDRVRAGGPDDPDRTPFRGGRRFRWLTRPMLIAFVVGAITLALTVGAYRG
jgi:hypothetical protein